MRGARSRKRQKGSGVRVKAVSETTAVDIEGFEDLDDRFGVDAPFQRPTDNVEVFLTGFEPIENAVQQQRVIVKTAFEEAEISAVQFDPEAFALQMFQPAGAQIAPPVTLDPASNGRLAKIAAGLLTFDPFETQRFLLAVDKNASSVHGSTPLGLSVANGPQLTSVLRQEASSATDNILSGSFPPCKVVPNVTKP
jgi:hypothetical protein